MGTKKKAVSMESNEPVPGCSTDEESINFRPSPNFKHMKKYMKSKFEKEHAAELEILARAQKEVDMANSSSTPIETSKSAPSANVQPPLPPVPPPPESPHSEIKQEVIEDYLRYINSDSELPYDQFTAAQHERPQTPPKAPEKGPTMCRNWVRGSCKKGSSCIFVHEIILKQLPGVYTFCRNFQNRQCTFPRCKFVHATVFEKEYFYRTGYLPPQATAHIKPGAQGVIPRMSAATDDTNAPLQDVTQHAYYDYDVSTMDPAAYAAAMQAYYEEATADTMNLPSTSAMDTQATSAMDTEASQMPEYMLEMPMASGSGSQSQMYADPMPSTSSATITCADMVQHAAMALQSDNTEYTDADMGGEAEDSVPTSCNGCSSSQFKYELYKNHVENMISEKKEGDEKLAQLETKAEALLSMLMTLCEPKTPTPTQNITDLGLISNMDDRSKTILQQINVLTNITSESSDITDEVSEEEETDEETWMNYLGEEYQNEMDETVMDQNDMEQNVIVQNVIGNLMGQNIMGQNIMGQNMMGQNMMSQNMMGQNMMGQNMMGQNMMGLNMMGQNMMGQNMMGQNMMGQNMMGQNMMGQNMMGQNMMGQNMMGQNMMSQNVMENILANFFITSAEQPTTSDGSMMGMGLAVST